MDITITEAFALMTSQGHQTFGATWIKKGGDLRTGSLRLKVSKGVTGAGLTYDPAAHGLLCAFDMNKINKKTGDKGAFLMLNLKGLQSIKVDGTTYNVRH
jgi:hypothetical protein